MMQLLEGLLPILDELRWETHMQTDKMPWYGEEAGFFGPGYLVAYEELLPAERTRQEIDFLEKTFALEPGARILDMPCGHGRHAVELAKRGYGVTGVDLNSFFLRKARDAAEEEGVSLDLKQGDMREISFDAEFDVALNLFTAVGYFDDDADDQVVFNNMCKSRKPGGMFVIDFINHDHTMRNFRRQDWRELPDGSMLLVEHKYDILSGKMIDRRVTIPKGGEPREITGLSCRIYTPAELVDMGAAVGLRLEKAYGDFSGSELSVDSKRVLLVFRKS
jgi:SAM-dependent methyltransferase